jgi:hypothetical protein
VTYASNLAQPGRSSRTAFALGRIGNVIVDPPGAFATANTHPTSALAFLTLVALRFTSVVVFYHPDVDPTRLAAGVLFQVITIWPLTALLTVLLWTTSRAWGARTSWASTYCVVVHVMLAYTLATIAIASIAGAILPETTNVELRHPPFTNLGALADPTANPIAHALLVELDYRSAYALILTFIGVRESAADRATPRAWLIVATCFAVNLVFTTVTTFARQS